MTVSTFTYTDNQTVQALTTVAKGAVQRNLVDLTAKISGTFMAVVGRGGATVITSGSPPLFIARPLINGGAAAGLRLAHPDSARSYGGNSGVAATNVACAASGNTAGASTLTANANITLAAGAVIFIDGSAGTGNSEFIRVRTAVSAATAIPLDGVLQFAHVNTLDVIRDQADVWSVEVPGGTVWEVLLDYGAAAAGDQVFYRLMLRTLDSVQNT